MPFPESSCVRIEKVYIMDKSRPHFSNIKLVVIFWMFKKYIQLFSNIYGIPIIEAYPYIE